MTRKTQKQTPEEIAEGQTPESTPEPKSEQLPGLGGVAPIEKPSTFSLDKFKSKQPANLPGVRTLLGPLPHYPIVDAKDFVRLHPDEAYWSAALCFVNVPIVGVKKDTIHLIDEALALQHLPPGKILRHALVLAAKPYDVFFLAHVPTTNLDNTWNESNLRGCKSAREFWTQLTSLKALGKEEYKIDVADPEAFPEPTWPKETLETLIGASFVDRAIESETHPGLLRLLGKKLPLK